MQHTVAHCNTLCCSVQLYVALQNKRQDTLQLYVAVRVAHTTTLFPGLANFENLLVIWTSFLRYTNMHLHVQRGCAHCSVLQCVAVCCSVLRCDAVCGNMLQCVAVCCSVLKCVVCCRVLQGVAGWCYVLQCVAVCARRVLSAFPFVSPPRDSCWDFFSYSFCGEEAWVENLFFVMRKRE